MRLRYIILAALAIGAGVVFAQNKNITRNKKTTQSTTTSATKPSATQSKSSGQLTPKQMYEKGVKLSSEKNFAQSRALILAAAEAGYGEAQFHIGADYFNGNIDNSGNPSYYSKKEYINYKKSFEWFMKGAQNNNGPSLISVGYAYLNGYGVPKDTAEAVKWFDKAAKYGCRSQAKAVLEKIPEKYK